MMINSLIIATHNDGKLKEFEAIFAKYNIKIQSSKSLGIIEPNETEHTFEGNAILKARFVHNITKLPTLADDSGLEVNALDGAPGVYSANWAGTPRNFNLACEKVLKLMQHSKDRQARFVCVLALILEDSKLITFSGHMEGTIATEPAGKEGFGYDKIFIPTGYSKPLAMFTLEEKNQISHRTKAIQALISWLNS